MRKNNQPIKLLQGNNITLCASLYERNELGELAPLPLEDLNIDVTTYNARKGEQSIAYKIVGANTLAVNCDVDSFSDLGVYTLDIKVTNPDSGQRIRFACKSAVQVVEYADDLYSGCECRTDGGYTVVNIPPQIACGGYVKFSEFIAPGGIVTDKELNDHIATAVEENIAQNALIQALQNGHSAQAIDIQSLKSGASEMQRKNSEQDTTLSGHASAISAINATLNTVSNRANENKQAIATLNGNASVEGSVDKKIADAINAFATALTDDGIVNTYAEALNYIATHGGEFTALLGVVTDNSNRIVASQQDVAALVKEVAKGLPIYSREEDMPSDAVNGSRATVYREGEEWASVGACNFLATDELEGTEIIQEKGTKISDIEFYAPEVAPSFNATFGDSANYALSFMFAGQDFSTQTMIQLQINVVEGKLATVFAAVMANGSNAYNGALIQYDENGALIKDEEGLSLVQSYFEQGVYYGYGNAVFDNSNEVLSNTSFNSYGFGEVTDSVFKVKIFAKVIAQYLKTSEGWVNETSQHDERLNSFENEISKRAATLEANMPNYVSWATSQTLTEANKTQARTNIGAVKSFTKITGTSLGKEVIINNVQGYWYEYTNSSLESLLLQFSPNLTQFPGCVIDFYSGDTPTIIGINYSGFEYASYPVCEANKAYRITIIDGLITMTERTLSTKSNMISWGAPSGIALGARLTHGDTTTLPNGLRTVVNGNSIINYTGVAPVANPGMMYYVTDDEFTDASHFFDGCVASLSMSYGNFLTLIPDGQITKMDYMFANLGQYNYGATIKLSKFIKTSGVTSMSMLFSYSPILEVYFDTDVSKVENVYNILGYTSNVRKIHLVGGFAKINSEGLASSFWLNCSPSQTITLYVYANSKEANKYIIDAIPNNVTIVEVE